MLSTSAQDILIRISRKPARIGDHEDEAKIGRELAERGICPAIFLDMRIRDASGKVYPATAIERMQHSLSDVQACPVLMRKMFVEADGESALFDLYMRACRFVRCIDTKPGNVVVSFDVIKGPRVALIDVDLAHCTRLGSWKYHEETTTPIRALDEYLSRLGTKRSNQTIPLTPMLTLTLSLLLHVTVAAGDYMDFPQEFGFPYPRITRVLLDNWSVVRALVDQDARSSDAADRNREDRDHRLSVLPRGTTVRSQIRHYCGEKDEKVICRWSELPKFLARMLRYPESEVLEVCSRSDSRMPRLYEFLVTMLGTSALTEKKYISIMEMDSEPASAENLEMLVTLAPEGTTDDGESGLVIPARCNLPSCAYHSEQRLLFYPNTVPNPIPNRVPIPNTAKRHRGRK